MVFTADEVARFRVEGYATVADFWSADEVAAMQYEVARLQREGKLRNVATDGDGVTHSKTVANLQLCPMSPHSPLFRALPFSPKVIEAVDQLIGTPVVLHLDQVFLKPAHHGAGTNWHQDNAYFRVADPLLGTAMWTAVHTATAANGTIRVVPGSFRQTMEHSRDPQSDHHIRCYPDETQAVTLELPAGGAAFFAYGVAHATGANRTDHERAGAAYHFLNGNAVSHSYFTDDGRMPHPVLSGPDATDGTPEYGECMRGSWERQVARVMGPRAAAGVS
jgi:ectoine hydroxylase-related dioxygenase (phytanoyl-CoA dioxygenase family)